MNVETKKSGIAKEMSWLSPKRRRTTGNLSCIKIIRSHLQKPPLYPSKSRVPFPTSKKTFLNIFKFIE